MSVDGEIEAALQKDDISQVKNILRTIKDTLFGFISNTEVRIIPAITPRRKGIRYLETRKSENRGVIETVRRSGRENSREYSALREEIDKEKDSSRDAEKAMFKIMAEQNEVSGKLRELEYREDKLKHSEESFKWNLKNQEFWRGWRLCTL